MTARLLIPAAAVCLLAVILWLSPDEAVRPTTSLQVAPRVPAPDAGAEDGAGDGDVAAAPSVALAAPAASAAPATPDADADADDAAPVDLALDQRVPPVPSPGTGTGPATAPAPPSAPDGTSVPVAVPSSYPIGDAPKYFVPAEQRRPGNLGGPPPLDFPGGPNDPAGGGFAPPAGPEG